MAVSPQKRPNMEPPLYFPALWSLQDDLWGVLKGDQEVSRIRGPTGDYINPAWSSQRHATLNLFLTRHAHAVMPFSIVA